MKVSVALCTYNGAPYIEKQLESILNQTRLPDEIVLSDDGSGDDTVLRARKLLSAGEIPFRILENPAVRFPTAAVIIFLPAIRTIFGFPIRWKPF